MLRGVEGHGEANRLRAARLLDLSTGLPVLSMAVERAEKMEKILPDIQAMSARGLIALTDVQVGHKPRELNRGSSRNLLKYGLLPYW